MSWTQLDDNFDSNPKLVRAVGRVGDSAGWMWVRAVNYCNKHLTDGDVPREIIPTLTKHRKPFEIASALVDCGVFDATSNGFRVHDYLDWNRSRDDVLARTNAARSRKDLWRSKKERERNASGTRHNVDTGTLPTPLHSTPLDPSDLSGVPAEKQKRQTAAPKDWEPNETAYAHGQSLGFSQERIGAEAKKFLNDRQAKGVKYVDWQAGFRTWLDKARGFDERDGRVSTPTETVQKSLYPTFSSKPREDRWSK